MCSPLFRRITRITVGISLGLPLFMACSTRDPIFSGMMDAQVPPSTATLSITRNGTSTGTVFSSPGDIACGATCSAAFRIGTMVTLTATADTGAEFAGWGSDGCTGTGTCMVTMPAAATVTATFNRILHTLTVVHASAGTVTSTPAGITCGTDCTEDYPQGAMVTLSAAANIGSTFAGWNGGGCIGIDTCRITMNMATTVSATYSLNTYALTVSTSGTGLGTILSTPPGITCGTACTESFGHGTMVTLTAMPSTGSNFGGWGGACIGNGDRCVVEMTAAASVSAIFNLSNGGGGGGGGGCQFPLSNRAASPGTANTICTTNL